MYGYFNYRNAYLRNNERVVFTGYYCRLCYCLWNKGGQKARYLTTYDATVYNLILSIAGFDECPPIFPCQRVKTTNKKFFKDDYMGNLITDIALLGFAVKVKDDETDGEASRAFWAKLLFKRLLKKTVENHRELFDKSYAAIVRLDKLQRGGAPVEEVLALYGKTMEDSFHYFFDLQEKYLRVLNLTAQWIFLIDMIDDYNGDVKNHAVNSLYREDSPTISLLFEKHYFEFIPLIRKISGALKEALDVIECEKTEWVILNKILRHSLATLVPEILDGQDVKYHYFRDTVRAWNSLREKRKVKRKYEKNSVHNKGD
ncbi:MAG: DUF5685 family protein [Roseburia sp.]|nr:DUF5685 family protein [Roseburia sp.]